MRAQGHKPTPDGLLERADRQFGILRYEDLRGAGLSPAAIGRCMASGRLTRIHHRVYAFGHTCLTDEGRWLAALWACDPSAALSHLSAGTYHRWRSATPGEPVHVSTTSTVTSRPGLVVHRVRHLDRVDVFRPHPLAVTTMPRTIVDLADVLPWHEFRSVADGLRRLPTAEITEVLRRLPNRRGAPSVRRLLEADETHTKSEFERRYLRFVAVQGLPRPDAVNVRIGRHTIDCLYREARLALELDGRAYHERRGQMRADRRRDSDLQLAGLHVLRLVWDDLHTDEAMQTAQRVGAMLALR
jgi:very-short-patch-repair endonuclease